MLEGRPRRARRAVDAAEPAADPHRAHCSRAIERHAADEVRVPGAEESRGFSGERELRALLQWTPCSRAQPKRAHAGQALDDAGDEARPERAAVARCFEQRASGSGSALLEATGNRDRKSTRLNS